MVAQNYISELGQNSHDIENSGICGHDSEWMRKWMNEWQTTNFITVSMIAEAMVSLSFVDT